MGTADKDQVVAAEVIVSAWRDDEYRRALLADPAGVLRAAGVTIAGASDHTVTHSLYVLDPDGNEIELFVDVLPAEAWRDDPHLVMQPTRPLAL